MGYGGHLSYYAVLGIKRSATSEEIRDAYRKQSIALHPDKNPFGAEVVKLVNEAYGELSDEKARAEYDRVSRKNQGSNCNGRDSSSSVIRSLKQKLAELESKQGMLKKKIVNLQGENCEIRGNLAQFKLSLYEKTSQNKQLQHKQKKIENEVDHLKSEKDLLERENQDQKRQIDVYEDKMDRNSRALMDERRKASDDFARSELKAKQKIEHIKKEVDHLKSEKDLLERENQDQKRQIDVYEDKMDRNSRALMDERRKASDDFARSELKAKQKIEHIKKEVDHLKSEKDLLERENQDQKRQIDVYEDKMDRNSRALMDERRKASDDFARSELKAKQKIEHIKKVTSERSVCYRCNGKSVSKEDCTVCNGNGAILGLW
eukprot:CAMPEP_0181127858 /NCGR_PEP_ID=MMETSP1071-20121207/28430_1 /TAXON_ID=35127 /ORGANISM="Thalassiosira sp., Strain NH16" /LENGTH=375 /DNA_ID=CAMNT_0023213641 /DNA_START=275 /DNA_END=1399 /DNA_ORIENTATION=+